MQIIFSLQDNAIFLIIKRITLFSRFSLHFDLYTCLTFLVLWGAYNILRAIVFFCFFSNFFQSFLTDGKYISFQLYCSIKGLIFDILWGSFLIYSWFNASVIANWKYLPSLFLGFIVAFLFFSHSVESIYDPPLFRLILWSL